MKTVNSLWTYLYTTPTEPQGIPSLTILYTHTLVFIGMAKNSVLFFPYDGSSSAQLSLISFKTILLDCIVTAVISACI